MKPTRHNKMLGIALGERSMLVAEVHASSAGPQVVKAAEFVYPEGQQFTKDPAALGLSLGHFLKEQGFTLRNAVFGLPARWVLSKSKEVPRAQGRPVGRYASPPGRR